MNRDHPQTSSVMSPGLSQNSSLVIYSPFSDCVSRGGRGHSYISNIFLCVQYSPLLMGAEQSHILFGSPVLLIPASAQRQDSRLSHDFDQGSPCLGFPVSLHRPVVAPLISSVTFHCASSGSIRTVKLPLAPVTPMFGLLL